LFFDSGLLLGQHFNHGGSYSRGNFSPEDLAKPFFVHPSDHPGLLLVSTPFDGTGFGSWKRTMTIALSIKSNIVFCRWKFYETTV